MKEIIGKIDRTYDKIIDNLAKGAMYAAAFAVITWVGIFLACLILRNFLHRPQPFLEEYTGYWLVIIICLGLAYTLRDRGHISIDALTKRLPERFRNIIEVFAILVGLIFTIVMTVEGGKLWLFGLREGSHNPSGSEALMWPVYLFIPIGYGLLSLALLGLMFRSVISLRKSDVEPEKDK